MCVKIMKTVKRFREKHEYLFLALVISCLSCILYHDFIFGDKLFLYLDANDDTFQSFLPLYHLVVNKLQNNSLSLFSMNSGLGDNLLGKQLALFDPFAVILYITGLVFGIEKMAYMLIYVHILKMVCAGLACSLFLSYTSISSRTRCLCSVLYAFSAYTVGDIGQHYFFATALVFVALGYALILPVTKKATGYWRISIFVMLLGIWSVYFAYMILIASALFFLYIVVIKEEKWRIKIGIIFNMGLSVGIGLLMSAFVLMPSAGLILTSTDRVNDGTPLLEKIKQSFTPFTKREYFVMVLRSISNQLNGNINSWSEPRSSFNTEHYFYCALVPAAVIETIRTKITQKDKKKVVIFIVAMMIVLISTLTHFGGISMNAFSEYSPRFLYVFMPFLAYAFGVLFTRIEKNELTLPGKYVIAAINIALVAITIVFFNKNDKTGLLSAVCVCSCLFLVTVLIVQIDNAKRYLVTCIAVVLIFHNLIDGFIALEIDRNIIGKEWYAANGVSRQIKQAVLDAGASGDDFWRFERCFLDWGVQPATMYSDTANYRGVSFYDSLTTPRINTFRRQMMGLDRIQPTRATYAFGEFGTPLVSDWADFLGIKYAISDYLINDDNWEHIADYDEKHLYRNKGIATMGLLYDSCCLPESVNDMSILEKQVLHAETVVANDISQEFVAEYRKNSLDEFIEYEDIAYIATGEKLNGRIMDLSSLSADSRTKWMILHIGSENEGEYSIKYDTGFGFYDFYWGNKSGHYTAGDSELVIPVPTGTIQAIFSCGDDVVFQEGHTAFLQNKDYENQGIQLVNDDMEGKITGTVECSDNRILMLPIIYDGNWKATVDGMPAELKEVDYCFIGMELGEGRHEIVLTYSTPFLRAGVKASIIGCVMFIIFITMEIFRSKKRKNNEEKENEC